MPSFKYDTIKSCVMMLGLTIITLPYQNCGSALQTGQALDPANQSLNSVIDVQAPAISILSPTAGSYVKSQTLLAGTCEDGFPVTYYIDAPKNSSTVLCKQGAYSLTLPPNLTDGNHTAFVSQTDLAGNKGSQSLQFMVDNNAPSVMITVPVTSSSHFTSSGVTIEGVCENNLEVALQGTALAASVSGPCINSKFEVSAVLNSASGSKNITASQIDGAGNNGSHSINLSLTVPSIPIPVVKITAPAVNFLTKNKSVVLQGTCQAPIPVNISGGGVASNSQATCNSGSFSATIQFSANDGLKNVIVAQTNSQNGTGQDSRSFQLDTTAPTIAIQSPAAGTQAQNRDLLGRSLRIEF